MFRLELRFLLTGFHVPESKLTLAVGNGDNPDDYSDLIAGPIWGSVPFRLTESPENKLRQWAEAILGIELGVGFELDTDLLLGRECRGITSQYNKRNTDSQGNPFKGHQVDSLLPKASTPTPQQAAPQQQGYAQQAYQQQSQPSPIQDPWGGGSDEPPF